MSYLSVPFLETSKLSSQVSKGTYQPGKGADASQSQQIPPKELNHITDTVEIPVSYVGLIIGAQGKTINKVLKVK